MDLIQVCLLTKTALQVMTIAHTTYQTYEKARVVYKWIVPKSLEASKKCGSHACSVCADKAERLTKPTSAISDSSYVNINEHSSQAEFIVL